MTKVYGTSDDLIEIEGDFEGEVSCYGTDDRDKGVLLVFSDGTIAEVCYSQNVGGVWAINLKNKGSLYEKIEHCTNPDASPYSDVLVLKEGIQWCYCSTKDWELVD